MIVFSFRNISSTANVADTRTNEYAHLKSKTDLLVLIENESRDNLLSQSFISQTSDNDSTVIVEVDNRLQESSEVEGSNMLQRSCSDAELQLTASESSLSYPYSANRYSPLLTSREYVNLHV